MSTEQNKKIKELENLTADLLKDLSDKSKEIRVLEDELVELRNINTELNGFISIIKHVAEVSDLVTHRREFKEPLEHHIYKLRDDRHHEKS